MMEEKRSYKQQSTKNMLLLAAWFGIFAGLGEGVILIALQASGRLTFASAEIIWIASIFNLVLFIIIGLALAIVGKISKNIPVLAIAILLFGFLTALDWIGLIFFERLYKWAQLIFAIGIGVALLRSYNGQPVKWMAFWNRSLPYLVGITLLFFVGFRLIPRLQEEITESNLAPARTTAPNILLIVIDTLRSDHVSGNGYPRNTTPNIDQLAEQGVSFNQAFSTSSYSLPSHVSLLTGMNVNEHDIEWDTPKALGSNSLPTLAEALRDAGYRTGGFSANLFWVTTEQGFNRGFLHFEDYFQTLGEFLVRPFFGKVISSFYYSIFKYSDIIGRRYAPDINRSVISWANRETDHPFFVFINYLDAHDPYLPPQPYRSQFSEFDNPGGLLNNDLGRIDLELTDDELKGEIDAYDGAIAFVDKHIGELVRTLKVGTSRPLMVIITSDHGEAFGEHDLYLHGKSLYREEIQVPLIMYYPSIIPADTRIDLPVSITSLPSTIMDLANLESQNKFPGTSLVQVWESRENVKNWSSPLVEIKQQDWVPERAPVHKGWLKSIISSGWQYIEHEVGQPELYNLQDDPAEANNLASNISLAPVVEKFTSEISYLLEKAKGEK